MAKLRDLNVNIYEGSDALQSLRDTVMTGRTSMGTALVFNLLNDLVDRIETLEAEPKCTCDVVVKASAERVLEEAAKSPTKTVARKKATETPKVTEEPTVE